MVDIFDRTSEKVRVASRESTRKIDQLMFRQASEWNKGFQKIRDM